MSSFHEQPPQGENPEASKFKTSVKEFDDVNDKLKILRGQVKILNTRKKQLEEVIIVFMNRNKVKQVVTKKAAITHTEKTRKAPVTKKELPNVFVQFFTECNQAQFNNLTPQQKATEIQEYIKSKGKTVTSSSLSCKKKSKK